MVSPPTGAISDIEDDATSGASTEFSPKKRPTNVTNLVDKIFFPERSADGRRTAVHRRRARAVSLQREIDKKPSKSGKGSRLTTMLALLGLAAGKSGRKQTLDGVSSGYDSGGSMYSDSSLAPSPPPRRRRGRSGVVEVTEQRKDLKAPSLNTYPGPSAGPAYHPSYPETQRSSAAQRAGTNPQEHSGVLKREKEVSSAADDYYERYIPAARASRSPQVNPEHPMPIENHKPSAAPTSQSLAQLSENKSLQAKVQ
ncbi:hypothetical protein V2G26_021226 [Clonostachys chloroleuca]